MITYAQAQTDFDRQLTYGGGARSTVSFLAQTRTSPNALKSAKRVTIENEMHGEVDMVGLSVRLKGNEFSPMPVDNDIVVVDGTNMQVAEVRYTASGATCRMFLLHVDS